MQKINLLFFSLLFSAITSAQTTNSEQVTVQQTIQNLFTALSNRDSAGLRLHSTADVHFYEYGEVWTIDTLIKKVMYVKPADYKRTNSFEFVETTIDGNTAWVTYYLQSEITRNGKKEIVKWMETVVLVKQKEQWKIQLLHSSLISRT
ncbi:MAG TPA: nuclear transport factor 2 family protein [Lacibacter sp.]|nr:nuclear transport factor 2 family protein [Lacibacter sp.]